MYVYKISISEINLSQSNSWATYYIFDPWTMPGLGTSTSCTVKISSITFDSPKLKLSLDVQGGLVPEHPPSPPPTHRYQIPYIRWLR